MSLRDEILENNPEMEFEEEKFDSALIGVVEKFGGDMEPLYDWDVLKNLPIPYENLPEFDSHILFKMTMDEISEKHGDALIADGYDDEVLGVVSKKGEDTVVIYDREAVIEKKESEIMSEEDYEGDPDYPAITHAIEDYSYNFIGGYLGSKTWKCATLYKEYEQK